MTALKECNFSELNWFQFGLKLGLHYNTLKRIESEYPNNLNQCLTECLTKWLSKTDSVVTVGPLTYQTLASTLEKIGEKTASETLKASRGIFDKFIYFQ